MKQFGTAREPGRQLDPTRREILKMGAGTFFSAATARKAWGLGEPRRAEIAVVGAGPFGAATAMDLAARGSRDVILIGPAEHSPTASSATALASHFDESRNSTAMDSDPEWAEMARSSYAPLRALESRSGMKILHEIGSLRVTQGRLAEGYFDLGGIRKTAADLGVQLVDLGSDALAARYPDARFDANSLGLLQERGAGLIRPRRLVAALRKVAIEDGATWIDDAVTRIEPRADHVDLQMGSGTTVRAERIVVATGAAAIGQSLLSESTRASVKLRANQTTNIEVPDEFETKVPAAMITNSSDSEFFGGFVAPPLRYADGRRYIKVVGEARSLVDGTVVPDQVDAAVRAARRLFPSLTPGAVDNRVCMTTDTAGGKPIVDWVDARIAVAIAGNGKGVKAALEIGRRAASLVAERL